MAGGWAVSQGRVAAAEDGLTVLESTAPDDAGEARARALRDAVRDARARMQRLVAPGQHDTWALDLDTLMIDLQSTLRPAATPTPPA
jgi:predicted nuclease with TOPRIM domain